VTRERVFRRYTERRMLVRVEEERDDEALGVAVKEYGVGDLRTCLFGLPWRSPEKRLGMLVSAFPLLIGRWKLTQHRLFLTTEYYMHFTCKE